LGKFNGSFLGYEKIIIVELDGICSPAVFDIFYILIGMERRFGFPPGFIGWDYGAE
jgi:hypothetical protein